MLPRGLCRLFEGALSLQLISRMVAEAASHLQEAEVVNPLSHAYVNEEVPRAKVCFFSRDAWPTRSIEPFIREANVSWNIDWVRVGRSQLAEYGVDDHFHWHRDCEVVIAGDADRIHRKITAIAFLSDSGDYEGGNLELRDSQGAVYRDGRLRVAGNLLVFPSFLEHRVSPVSRGLRRSFTVWAFGPPWR